MKTVTFHMLILLLTLGVLQAQDVMVIKHSCSFDEEETNQEFYYFGASSEADKIVEEIVNAVSLSKNFVVKSSDCKNALATKEGNTRYILYNTSFLENFKKDAKTKWAAYCVLAHEIGHHLNGHDFESTNSKLRKKMELQADVFAGGVLQKLGATLEEAKAGIELLQNKGGSDTHPPVRARAEAIANGWKKSEELNPKNKPVPKPIVDDEEESDNPVDPGVKPNPGGEELFTVSDQLITNTMIGTWNLDLGYNDFGQYVTVRNMLYADGSMSEQTFLNGVVSTTGLYTWRIHKGTLFIYGQGGFEARYTPAFNGNNIVVLTFISSNGQAVISQGTQLYYTRVF